MRFIPRQMIADELASDASLSAGIDAVYEALEGRESVEEYHKRHMTPSLGILTVHTPAEARRLVKPIRGQILNKSVVEIGAGIGLFALELARYSPKVFAIESDPGWSWLFTKHLYEQKPAHLTWIFGRAEEVAHYLKADVAIIVTRSRREKMEAVARRMAPLVLNLRK